jgi:hypothetical protein
MAVVVCVSSVQMTADAIPITYVTQQRFVEVSAYLSDPGESLSERIDATDFEPFDAQIDLTFDNGESAASGHAGQSSRFLEDRITASGSVAGSTGPPVGTSSGAGNAFFAVGFQIEAQSQYQLRLMLDDIELGSYELTGPSLNHIGEVSIQPVSIIETGDLQPGAYSFQIDVKNSGVAENFTGTFELDFSVVPEPTSLFWIGLLSCGVLLRRRVGRLH